MTGSGTVLDPYIIYDVNDLQDMNLDLTAYYELANDIDASATVGWNAGAGFVPVGTNVSPFTGYFDGKNYTISGLHINRPAENRVGLFGYTRGATLSSVNVANCSIVGADDVGVLVGVAVVTTISGCKTSGTITAENFVGGLVGDYILSTASRSITDCSSSVGVVIVDYAGGLIGMLQVGAAFTATILRCFTTGNVFVSDSEAGGLIGYLVSIGNTVINDCYATGNVSSLDDNIGGLIGLIQADGNLTIDGCHATGNVTGVADDIGGLIGSIQLQVGSKSTISRCYATGNVTAEGTIGGLIGLIQADDELTIEKCYATGDVTGVDGVWPSEYIGGFIALLQFSGAATVINNCYAEGDASGADCVAGFIGNTDAVAITCCYSRGKVTGTGSDPGGFIGIYNGVPAISACFWDIETSGQAASSGGVGLPTAQMKDIATFGVAGWNLETIWKLYEHCNNGYPCLYKVTPMCTSPWLPAVSTMPATGITENAATLNGYLQRDGGGICELRFQWGASPALYAVDTPWIGGKITGDTLSVTLTDLSSGALYHFRAQARVWGTIYSGIDMAFIPLTPAYMMTLLPIELTQKLGGTS
jgi:hypothetical protein